MNPKIPDELISAYFDGEVTPEERRQIERLLETSPDVRQWLDDTSKLSAMLHSFPREAVPADLSSNVQKQIESIAFPKPPSVPQTRRSLRREWMAFAAGMVTTVASLFLLVAIRPTDHGANWKMAPRAEGMFAKNVPSTAVLDARSLASSEMSLADAGNGIDNGIAGVRNESSLGVNVKESISAPASATAVAVSAPEAKLSDSSDLVEQMFSVADVDVSPLQPQPTDEFLVATNNGDVSVIQQRFLDPNSAVAAVELNARDVDRGMERLESLLEKHQLKRLDESDSLDAAGGQTPKPATATFAADSKDKASVRNEVGLLFVCAPGPQVAETLREAIKDDAIFYGQIMPQLPVELPSVELMVENETSRDGSLEGGSQGEGRQDSDSDKKGRDAGPGSPAGIADGNGLKMKAAVAASSPVPQLNFDRSSKEQIGLAEATCAVNSVAQLKNYSVNNLSRERVDLATQFTINHSRIQNSPVGTILNSNGQPSDSSSKEDQPKLASSGKVVAESASKSESAEAGPACYASFRATRDDKQQNAEPAQRASQRGNSLGLPRSQKAGQEWLAQDGYAIQYRAMNRSAGGRQSAIGQRDAQLMRMVIIVKKPDSESPNP